MKERRPMDAIASKEVTQYRALEPVTALAPGCGPHLPHEDLEMHMRQSAQAMTDRLLFSEAFKAGQAIVWYECPRCHIRYLFTNKGVEVVR